MNPLFQKSSQSSQNLKQQPEPKVKQGHWHGWGTPDPAGIVQGVKGYPGPIGPVGHPGKPGPYTGPLALPSGPPPGFKLVPSMDKQQDRYDAVRQLANFVGETVVQKNKDYGSSNIEEFGTFGLVVRLNDKMGRLKNLYNKDANNYEAMEDTVLDIAGYALILHLLLKGKW